METVRKRIPFRELFNGGRLGRLITDERIAFHCTPDRVVGWLALQEQRKGISNWANANPDTNFDPNKLVGNIPRTGMEGWLYGVKNKGKVLSPSEAIVRIGEEVYAVMNRIAKSHSFRNDGYPDWGAVRAAERIIAGGKPTPLGVLTLWEIANMVVENLRRGMSKEGEEYRMQTRRVVSFGADSFRVDASNLEEIRPMPPEWNREPPINPVTLSWSQVDRREQEGLVVAVNLMKVGDPVIRFIIPELYRLR